jgi:hypothetical protein
MLAGGRRWSGAGKFSVDETLGRLFHATVLECAGQFRPMIVASPVAHRLADQQME